MSDSNSIFLISILLPDLSGGGAERVMIDLARAISLRGYEIEFVLMRAEGEFLHEAHSEFSIIDLLTPRTRDVPLALARYLFNRKPRAMIVNMWPLTSSAVLGRLLSRHKCKLMLVEHSILRREYAPRGRLHNTIMALVITATYRIADVVVAVSKGSAKDTAYLAGLKLSRVNVIYNPIPQKKILKIDQTELVDNFWNCMPGQRILTVGSLKAEKNHSLLLKSFALMVHKDSKLIILGNGKGGSELRLRSLAKELGIDKRVIFAGFHADPSPFYVTADLFVLSSDYEGFGNVIVEALSFGLPVVSTDCPSGPAEILENGRFGRLVPVGNSVKLAQAMDVALDKPVDCDDQKRRASDFSPEIAACQYLELLKFS
ncbi:glycosyltransferase [Amylibacter sp.]|nr:glycosyltransferase [Amylibacter sp.]